MNLYLVQHGEAEAREGETERSLTEAGIAALRQMAAFLDRRRLPPLEAIYHSGKLRARQTAELLGGHIESARGLLAADDLAPNSDPKIRARKLRDTTADLMLVGHMPHLSKLASLLVTHDANLPVVQIHNAGIVCLERDIDQLWRVEWAVIPRIIP